MRRDDSLGTAHAHLRATIRASDEYRRLRAEVVESVAGQVRGRSIDEMRSLGGFSKIIGEAIDSLPAEARESRGSKLIPLTIVDVLRLDFDIRNDVKRRLVKPQRLRWFGHAAYLGKLLVAEIERDPKSAFGYAAYHWSFTKSARRRFRTRSSGGICWSLERAKRAIRESFTGRPTLLAEAAEALAPFTDRDERAAAVHARVVAYLDGKEGADS
ncbi:MAG: hypothetical protein DWQ35_00355 [Planctomycetota bacterium]|nr:MAG: hypothetical protein DWQ35_00355 [Planctomycetota bacterium]